MAQALDCGHRIDSAAAKDFGERRFAAGIERVSLGDRRIAAGDKAHADAVIAAFAQIVNGVVARRLGRVTRNELPGGACDSAKMSDEAGKPLTSDLDCVVVGSVSVAQGQPNLAAGRPAQ